MDPINDYTLLHGLIDSIAARAVIHLDNMTLGQHPDGAARDEGKLALLDWSVAGGSIVADGWEACVLLTRRTSPARALGAALAAAVKVDDRIADDLPLLSGLAVGADNLASRTAGGPADAPLRLALCARGLAFGMLGEEGDARSGYDTDYNWRRLGGGMDREEAQLGVEARDFASLCELAFLPLTEGDRALLGAVSNALPPMGVGEISEAARTALVRTLERAGWQLLAVDIDITRETARIELRRGATFVTFDARDGKATTTRERQEIRQERFGRKGDICMVDRVHMHFIGRAHHDGVAPGLRWLTDYIADNSSTPLPASEIRRMLAPMMAKAAEKASTRHLQEVGLIRGNPAMQPFPAEPAEPTYTITVDARDEAAERWYWQADEADLTRTLASARDLARDLEISLILRDEAGFIRAHVDATGNYRFV